MTPRWCQGQISQVGLPQAVPPKQGWDSFTVSKVGTLSYKATVEACRPVPLTEVGPTGWAPVIVSISYFPGTVLLCGSQALTCLPP